ncbi:hypothetical protein LCGC14_0949810, partial [marine sediment metagenome]
CKKVHKKGEQPACPLQRRVAVAAHAALIDFDQIHGDCTIEGVRFEIKCKSFELDKEKVNGKE